MTTPDDTRGVAVLLNHAPELWRDSADRWVRWECRCGEAQVYPDGFADQEPLQRDAANHVLAALRDSGWVDPEVAAQRQKIVERLKQALAHGEAIVAQRDALLPVAEAAKAWREMRRGSPATPKPESATLIAAIDTWESREQPKITKEKA